MTDLPDNIAVMRFMPPSSAKRFMQMNAEIAPSLGGVKVPFGKAESIRDFGNIGLLANPDELDPKKNDIYRHDAWTPLSPRLYPVLDEAGKEEFGKKFGDVSHETLKEIAGSPSLNQMSPDAMRNILSQIDNIAAGQKEKIPDRRRADFQHDVFRQMKDFIGDNARSYFSPEIKDFSDEGVRKYIDENSRHTDDDAPWWMRRIDTFSKPVENIDELNDILNNYLSSERGGEAPSSARHILGNAIRSEFKGKRGYQTLTEPNRNYDYMSDLLERGDITPSEGMNHVRMGKELSDFLGEINSRMKDKNLQENENDIAGNAAYKLKNLPTDYVEVKPPRLFSQKDYAGVLYPDKESDVWRKGTEPQVDKLIGMIKDIYGDKAVPYSIKNRVENGLNMGKESNINDKIGELMKKAGF